MKWALSVLYVALAVAANYLASKYVLHVPLTNSAAPAGWVAVGAILVLRDWTQQVAGLVWTLLLVPVGGLLSYGIGEAAGWTSLQRIALASLAAFVVSETLEAAVFTPLRRRNLTWGVAVSGTVGNAADSAVFLWLAGFALFGPGGAFVALFVGKAYMIGLGTLATAYRRRLLPVVVPS